MKLSEMRGVFYILGGVTAILSLAAMGIGIGSAVQLAKTSPDQCYPYSVFCPFGARENGHGRSLGHG